MEEIHKKLFKLRKNIGAITKKETNPFLKSKYFSINGLLEQIDPMLEQLNLLLIQPIIDEKVTTKIIDIDSGQSVESAKLIQNFTDAQKVGGAITYYRRYTLQTLLGLQADDDDGNKLKQKRQVKDFDKMLEAVKKGSCSVGKLVREYNLTKQQTDELWKNSK